MIFNLSHSYQKGHQKHTTWRQKAMYSQAKVSLANLPSQTGFYSELHQNRLDTVPFSWFPSQTKDTPFLTSGILTRYSQPHRRLGHVSQPQEALRKRNVGYDRRFHGRVPSKIGNWNKGTAGWLGEGKRGFEPSLISGALIRFPGFLP